MSRIPYSELYNMIIREGNEYRRRANSGVTVTIDELEMYVNHINHVMSLLPVGTDETDVPEGAYNNLVRIREGMQTMIDNYYRRIRNEEQSQSGGYKKNKKIKSKKQKKRKLRYTRRRKTFY
jgi:hypothetical protein